MIQYWSLVRVLTKSLSMSRPQDKRRRVMMMILGLFGVFGVLLPVTFVSGLIVKLMTETLIPLGCESMGVELMFDVISVFTMIFGVHVIFNEFYFSNDLEYILPLPFKPYQVAAAKFTAAFTAENMMQFMLSLASVIGFGIAAKMPVISWLLAVVGIVTIPIVPMLYCAMISMLVMYFTRIIRNKEVIQRISTILVFVIVLIIVGSITTIQNLDIDHYVEALVSNDQTFFKVMRIVFPTIPLFVRTFAGHSLLALVEYVLVTVIFICIFLVIAHFTYYDGLIGLSAAGTKKKRDMITKKLAGLKMHSPAWALFSKEVKVLLRTPPFFINCVAINFMWPVFVYAMLKISHQQWTFHELRMMYLVSHDVRLQLMIPLIVTGLSLLMTAINSIGSNAISREGSAFSYMKYIPVPYSVQWNVKAMVSICFSAVGIWVFVLPVLIYMGMGPERLLMNMVLSVLCMMMVTYTGILIDSMQPKLIWDDEMSALRENYNTFYNMAIAIVEAVVLCGGGFLLVCQTNISIADLYNLLLLLVGMGNVIVLYRTYKNQYRNIAEQEET